MNNISLNLLLKLLLIIILVAAFIFAILCQKGKSTPKKRKDTKGGTNQSSIQKPPTAAEKNPPRNHKPDQMKSVHNIANDHSNNSNNDNPTKPTSSQGSSTTRKIESKGEDDSSITINSPNAQEPTSEAPTAPEVPIKPIPHISYFFAAPTPNGEFLHKYSTTTPNPSTSIYEIKAIDNDGKVFIYLNINIIKILKVERDSILRPVCDLQNIPNSTHTKLTTLKPGEMYLEGDKWKLKSKAIVKFE